MIELQHDALQFSFPDVHESARMTISFKRTLRIPDDGERHFLPPGLGDFPLRHVDDGTDRVPAEWLAHGGVMLPMYQAEAMWIHFSPGYDQARQVDYPFAIRIAAGKINAVTGQQWTDTLQKKPQDYVVAPMQPWLDGFCVSTGTIRQFVAMPLGQGYTAEEQITGAAEHGGLQIVVHPMKREVFERRFPMQRRFTTGEFDGLHSAHMVMDTSSRALGLGLAPGGQMKQAIYADPFGFNDWDRANTSRCFVHIANSKMWRVMTGDAPPTKMPTASDYSAMGLPWFDYYGEGSPLDGAPILAGLESVHQMGEKNGATPLPENAPAVEQNIVTLGRRPRGNQVREGSF